MREVEFLFEQSLYVRLYDGKARGDEGLMTVCVGGRIVYDSPKPLFDIFEPSF